MNNFIWVPLCRSQCQIHLWVWLFLRKTFRDGVMGVLQMLSARTDAFSTRRLGSLLHCPFPCGWRGVSQNMEVFRSLFTLGQRSVESFLQSRVPAPPYPWLCTDPNLSDPKDPAYNIKRSLCKNVLQVIPRAPEKCQSSLQDILMSAGFSVAGVSHVPCRRNQVSA